MENVAIGALWSKTIGSGTGLARNWSEGTDLERELDRLEVDPVSFPYLQSTAPHQY